MSSYSSKLEQMREQKEKFVEAFLADFDAWFDLNKETNKLNNITTKHAEDIMFFSDYNFSI